LFNLIFSFTCPPLFGAPPGNTVDFIFVSFFWFLFTGTRVSLVQRHANLLPAANGSLFAVLVSNFTTFPPTLPPGPFFSLFFWLRNVCGPPYDYSFEGNVCPYCHSLLHMPPFRLLFSGVHILVQLFHPVGCARSDLEEPISRSAFQGVLVRLFFSFSYLS